MTPKEVVTKWVDTFNKADANLLAEFYSDNAVNHQVANEPINGKAAIEKMFQEEFSKAEMVCIPENIFEDGERAIIEWKRHSWFERVRFLSHYQRLNSFSAWLLGQTFFYETSFFTYT